MLKFLLFLSFLWSCDLTSAQTPKVSALLQVQSLHVGSLCIQSLKKKDPMKVLELSSTGKRKSPREH